MDSFLIVKSSNGLIVGSGTLQELVRRCQIYRPILSDKTVAIVTFSSWRDLDEKKSLACRISLIHKTIAFKSLGFRVKRLVLPYTVLQSDFADILDQLNEDVSVVGVIVQRPLPSRLDDTLMKLVNEKDIDAVATSGGRFKVCAAAASTLRILLPLSNLVRTVAVVGGKGFVGSAVVKGLAHHKVDHFILDMGDDLRRIHDAQAVVTATGQPQLLDQRHLTSKHQVVIDIGCAPARNHKLTIFGDVNRSVYPIVRRITPVPGGIGPLQIAVLLERTISLSIGQEIVKWSYLP